MIPGKMLPAQGGVRSSVSLDDEEVGTTPLPDVAVRGESHAFVKSPAAGFLVHQAVGPVVERLVACQWVDPGGPHRTEHESFFSRRRWQGKRAHPESRAIRWRDPAAERDPEHGVALTAVRQGQGPQSFRVGQGRADRAECPASLQSASGDRDGARAAWGGRSRFEASRRVPGRARRCDPAR